MTRTGYSASAFFRTLRMLPKKLPYSRLGQSENPIAVFWLLRRTLRVRPLVRVAKIITPHTRCGVIVLVTRTGFAVCFAYLWIVDRCLRQQYPTSPLCLKNSSLNCFSLRQTLSGSNPFLVHKKTITPHTRCGVIVLVTRTGFEPVLPP